MTDTTQAAAAPVSDAKKFEKPSREDLDKALAVLDEKIKEHKAVVDAVNMKLDSVSKDKKAAAESGEKDKEKEKKFTPEQIKLHQIRDESKKLQNERRALFDEQKKLAESKKKALVDFDAAKKRLGDTGCKSVDEVTAKIASLEASLSTTAVGLKDEKAVILKIKSLSGSKKVFGEFEVLKQARDKIEASLKENSQKLDASKVRLAELKAEEETQTAKITGLKEKRQENRIDFPALMEKRTSARAEMDKLYAEIKSLRSDFKKREDAWRAFINEKRKEQKERQKAEYEARKEQDRLRQLEREEEKQLSLHADKFASIEQLKTYLKQFVEVEEEKAPEQVATKAETPGFVAIGKHAQVFDDDVFGTKVQKKVKAKKAPKKKTGPMVHDLKCIVEFESLGVTAPLSPEAIPGALEALEKKRLELVQDKENQRTKHEQKKAAILAGIATEEAKVEEAATETAEVAAPTA